jgi:replicative DNA helicase
VRPESARSYEAALVGAAITWNEILDEIGMQPSDFTTVWAQKAWTAISRLVLNGDPATELTIHDLDPELLVSELAEASTNACSRQQVGYWAREICMESRRRLKAALEEGARRLGESNGTDPMSEVVDMVARALDAAPPPERPKPLGDLVEEIMDEMPARRDRGRPGVSTGFPLLDSLTGGLRPGALYVVAAETGVGKSLFAANLLLSARVPSIVFSLEMDGHEVAERMLAAACSISTIRLVSGSVERSEVTLHPDRARILIDDRPAPSMEEIAFITRALRRQEKIELAIVDYLQIIRTPKGERREAEVAAAAYALRAMARSLSLSVIALAQLNRDGQVRDSAAIEHAAHVLAIFEREKGAEAATLRLQKNRSGPEGVVRLLFDKRTLRLREEQR